MLDFDRGRMTNIDWLLRAAILLAACLCLAVTATTNLSFDLSGTAMPVVALVLMVVIGVVYSRLRPAPRLAATAATAADLLALAIVLAAASYMAAAKGGPSAAAAFAGLDRRLGFDWLTYTPFVKSLPWFNDLLAAAYSSMIFQLGLLVIAFAVMGRLDWLRFTVNGFGLMALTAVAVSYFWPAVASDIVLGTMHATKTAQGWVAPVQYVQDFLNLRDGTMTRIPIMASTGIVTFPSFHTMCGVLYAVCFAQSRWLRWPGVILNALLIAATPVDGGHYMVDILAGIVLSTAILGAMVLYARAPQRKQQFVLAPAE